MGLLLVLLFSCSKNLKEKLIPNFEEQELSFLHLRFGYDPANHWIKKPQNILMLHETLKLVGYHHFMDHGEWESEGVRFIDSRKSPKNLVDSLALSFGDQAGFPVYYKEFWNRRKVEKNEDEVYHVVNEIKSIMRGSIDREIDMGLVNDTLATLLSFEFPPKEIDDVIAQEHLDYLIKIGLHQSAYNLVSGERYEYEDIDWKGKDEDLIDQLNLTKKGMRPWFEDDTK